MIHKRPESLSSQPHPTPSLPISQEESSHQKPNPPETWTCSIQELQESKFLCVCAQLRGPVGLFATYGLLPARLLRLWDFSGKITEVGCHFLLQGIFLTLSSVQFSSVTQSCPTLWHPVDCSKPGFPDHHQLLELAQTLVQWILSTLV